AGSAREYGNRPPLPAHDVGEDLAHSPGAQARSPHRLVVEPDQRALQAPEVVVGLPQEVVLQAHGVEGYHDVTNGAGELSCDVRRKLHPAYVGSPWRGTLPGYEWTTTGPTRRPTDGVRRAASLIAPYSEPLERTPEGSCVSPSRDDGATRAGMQRPQHFRAIAVHVHQRARRAQQALEADQPAVLVDLPPRLAAVEIVVR